MQKFVNRCDVGHLAIRQLHELQYIHVVLHHSLSGNFLLVDDKFGSLGHRACEFSKTIEYIYIL